MIVGFIIAILVLLTVNSCLQLLNIGYILAEGDRFPIISVISLIANLCLMTWGILALINL